MRYSTIAAVGLCASMALGAPVVRKDLITDVVVEYVYVTVTEDWPPAPTTTQPAVVNYPGVPNNALVAAAATTSKAPAAAPTSSTVAIIASSSADPVAAAASTGVPGSSSSDDAALPSPSDYKSTVLYHHNIHRRNHSASDLVYDDTLASYAATVAAKCVFAHDLTPGGGGYGQNIADSGSTDPDESSKDPSLEVAGVITDMWYNVELPFFLPSYYGEANPDFSNFDAWGHFTQVVWKATGSVGCATQYCASGTSIFAAPFSGWFTVCNYSPEGNMGGEYGDNVGEPLGHPTVVV